MPTEGQRLWVEEVQLGLGLWQGSYQGIERLWLRWYDAAGAWIPTPAEQVEQQSQQKQLAQQQIEQERQRADQERQRAEQERQRAERERQRADSAQAQLESLKQQLRDAGIDPEQYSELPTL